MPAGLFLFHDEFCLSHPVLRKTLVPQFGLPKGRVPEWSKSIKQKKSEKVFLRREPKRLLEEEEEEEEVEEVSFGLGWTR